MALPNNGGYCGLWKIKDGMFVCLQDVDYQVEWAAHVQVSGSEHKFTDVIDFEDLDKNYSGVAATNYIIQLKKDYFYNDILEDTIG